MIRFKKPHEQHAALTQAFAAADAGTPKDKVGNAKYGFNSKGMPASPARMASVKKAAAASAAARSTAAKAKHAIDPKLGQAQTTSTGGLGLVSKKKGLLTL